MAVPLIYENNGVLKWGIPSQAPALGTKISAGEVVAQFNRAPFCSAFHSCVICGLIQKDFMKILWSSKF